MAETFINEWTLPRNEKEQPHGKARHILSAEGHGQMVVMDHAEQTREAARDCIDAMDIPENHY